MSKVNSRSSVATLVAYGAELGVKLDETKSKEELFQQVQELEASLGLSKDAGTGSNETAKDNQLTGATGDTAATAKTQQSATGETAEPKAKKKPRFAIINIHPIQQPTDDAEQEPDTHCVIGFDGTNYQVQFGQEVKVPYGVYSVIKNAVNKRYVEARNAQGQKYLKETLRPRYPHTLVGFAEA